MRKSIMLLFAIGLAFSALAQQPYFQQDVKYTIHATLIEQQKAIKGHLKLNYTNRSPDTLQFIWFHIWPNAYANSETALMKQLNRDPETRKKVKKMEKGYMDSLAFTNAGKPIDPYSHPEHNDILKLPLTQPLLPGATVTIETPFYNRLPGYISRSGEFDGQFIATQWYPKPAVYDREGWHPMPYVDQGEFYSEFGDFEVHLTLPATFAVAATGTLQNDDELALYKKAGLANNKSPIPEISPIKLTDSGVKTLVYKAENVHDFAWFAQSNFVVQYDTMALASGRIIDVFSYYRPQVKREWSESVAFLKNAIRFYSNAVGEYPFEQVTAVQGPQNINSGGMEYPMLTLITVDPKKIMEQLEPTIVHEVGHNWFYGILGTNERMHPWMDEGMNTYFQFKYEALQNKNSVVGTNIPAQLKEMPPDQFFPIIMQALAQAPFTEAVATPAEAFTGKQAYGMTAYLKTAVWMYILESRMGQEAFAKGIKDYYEQWKFKHPQPSDLQKALEKSCGFKLDNIFSLLDKTGKFM